MEIPLEVTEIVNYLEKYKLSLTCNKTIGLLSFFSGANVLQIYPGSDVNKFRIIYCDIGAYADKDLPRGMKFKEFADKLEKECSSKLNCKF